MNILIVGAGATGTVLASALLRAGARVSFLVREPHRERLRKGLRLNHQGLWGLTAETITQYAILTSVEEVASYTWDQVWITTPSDALRGDWLPALLKATGIASLVVFQPDPEDIDYVRRQGAGERVLVQGLVQFSAWQSPLPHEPADRQGVTWFAPPGPAALFDAGVAAGGEIAALLRRGGLRAGTRHDIAAYGARLSALMIPLMAALEIAGWKLSALARHPVLPEALDAACEAVVAEATLHDVKPPAGLRIALNRPLLWLLLQSLPRVPGFPVEAFLAYHFHKVSGQTRQMMATYVRHAHQAGSSAVALQALLAQMPDNH